MVSPIFPSNLSRAGTHAGGERKDFAMNTVEFFKELAYDAFTAPLLWLLRNWAVALPAAMLAGIAIAVALLLS